MQAMLKIVEDGNEPLFLRRDACRALGSLPVDALAMGVKHSDIVRAVANFTLTLAKAGSPRVDTSLPPDLSKAEDVFTTPKEGKGFNMPGVAALNESVTPKKLFADGVAYYLHCVAMALGGEGGRGLQGVAGLDPKTSDQVKALLSDHVNPMLIAMSPTTNNLHANKLISDLTAGRGKLEAWMQTQTLIAAPAAAPVPVAGGAGSGAGSSGTAGGAPPIVTPGTLATPVSRP